MADQVVVANSAPNSSVPSTSPTVPSGPAELPASLTESQGVAALDRMRARRAEPNSAAPAALTVATPVTEQSESSPAITDPPSEHDTDEDVPVDEEFSESGEETTPEQAEIDPVAFHLDDGTPVSADEAKKGYLRREDYSQKTEVVKELTANVQARLQIVDQAAEFISQRLPYVMDIIQKSIPDEPDEALRQTDPGKYWDQYNLRRAKQGQLQQLEREMSALNEHRSQQSYMEAQAKFVSESQKLLEALPSWKNPKVAAKERQAVVAYGRKMGYTDNELATIDHRGVLVIRDAMLGARVRAAGGKNTGRPNNPTIPANKTAGIGAPKQTPAQARVDTPKIDPNASSRARFNQGVAMLAARRPH